MAQYRSYCLDRGQLEKQSVRELAPFDLFQSLTTTRDEVWDIPVEMMFDLILSSLLNCLYRVNFGLEVEPCRERMNPTKKGPMIILKLRRGLIKVGTNFINLLIWNGVVPNFLCSSIRQ